MADHNNEKEPDWPEQQVEPKSKTQLKKESEALQKLGEELVNLTEAWLAKLPLDEELAEAIQIARKINRKKDGFRRQLQFIGKLMRNRETASLAAALAKLKAPQQQATQAFHLVEQSRDAILQQGDPAIQQLLQQYPDLDRQKLRQLSRQANKEKQQNKPPKAARELFKYLKEQLQE